MKFNIFIADEIKTVLINKLNITCHGKRCCPLHIFLDRLKDIFHHDHKSLTQIHIEVK